MKKWLQYCFLGICFFEFSCQNDNKSVLTDHKTEENALKNEEARINNFLFEFGYLSALEINWPKSQVELAMPEHYKVFVDDENYYSFQYKDSLFHVIASFGFYEEDFSTDYSISLEVKKGEEDLVRALFDKMEDNVSQHWITHLQNSKAEENYVTWEINKDERNFKIHMSMKENHFNINGSSNAVSFSKEEDEGEWVQVGEDGRWIFVPNN